MWGGGGGMRQLFLFRHPPPPPLSSVALEYVLAKRVPPAPSLPPAPPSSDDASAGGAGAPSLWAKILPGGRRLTGSGVEELGGHAHVASSSVGGSPGSSSGGSARRSYASSSCLPRSARAALHGPAWAVRIWVAPYLYICAWAVAEAMSVLLLWSEATIFLNLLGWVPVRAGAGGGEGRHLSLRTLASRPPRQTNLSVFGWLLWAADTESAHSYFSIQVRRADSKGELSCSPPLSSHPHPCRSSRRSRSRTWL